MRITASSVAVYVSAAVLLAQVPRAVTPSLLPAPGTLPSVVATPPPVHSAPVGTPPPAYSTPPSVTEPPSAQSPAFRDQSEDWRGGWRGWQPDLRDHR
jgi:hypothetical protein